MAPAGVGAGASRAARLEGELATAANVQRVLSLLRRRDASPTPRVRAGLALLRVACAVGLCVLWFGSAPLQPAVDALWARLRTQHWYRSVYMETVYVTALGAALYGLFWAVAGAAWARPHQLHRILYSACGARRSPRPLLVPTASPTFAVQQTVLYAVPLLLLDSVTRKQYAGVEEWQFGGQPRVGLQQFRALPLRAPSLRQMLVHTAAALVLYDAAFFLLHREMHRRRWLFRWLHAAHHRHGVRLNWAHTNVLTLAERLLIVLLANGILNVTAAHPLTRNLFVLPFVFMLVDTHSGLDLPVWYDKLLAPWARPFAGSRGHWAHHVLRDTKYQPFFAHLDTHAPP